MYTLESLNRLQAIEVDQDIKSLSHAVFPGTHCPLFGVALSASYIKNLVVVVVGTSECTYYTKNFAYHRQKGRDRVYSLVLEDQHVILGAVEQVEAAILEIIEIEQPEALMLVSTCVPEVIGEDYAGALHSLKAKVKTPLLLVQTEHFKSNSHIPGMQQAMKSLVDVMVASQQNQSVNILGHRQGDAHQTELVKLLSKHQVAIKTIIPSMCSIDELKTATSASLNIVTDMIALDLAQEMQKRFAIDYLSFDKQLKQATIAENYQLLQQKLGIDLQADLAAPIAEYQKLYALCQQQFKGMKLIYGNTPMMAFETVDFLSDLGMIPEFIQVRQLYEQDQPYKANLLAKGFNPYVSRIANIAPLRQFYKVIKAQLYVGHESPVLLKENGMKQIAFDAHAQKIGYELPIAMMQDLLKIFTQSNSKSTGGMMHGSM